MTTPSATAPAGPFVSDGPLRLSETTTYGDRRGLVIRDRVGVLAFIATDLPHPEYNANRVAFAHFAFNAANTHSQLLAQNAALVGLLGRAMYYVRNAGTRGADDLADDINAAIKLVTP